MKKSILALLLAVLMVASLLPAAAFADEGPEAKIGDKVYDTLIGAVAEVQTGETITLLRNVDNGSGVIVDKPGVSFTIDFDNYTYTVVGNLAGSSGTKSQCFQLLKGATVTMKDGAIVANNAGIKMIIQNYSNLTLNNMTLDATKGTNSVSYVMSNNCGDTVITGNTNITAKAGTKAFDVYYWPSGDYPEGLRVTIDKNMTGTITGIVEYANDKQNTEYVDKAKLNINGGNFVGSFNVSVSGGDAAPASINVSGGSFSTPVAPKYLDESLKYQVKNGSTYTYYDTFENALAAAQNGAVIENVVQGLGAENFTLTIDPANGGAKTVLSLPKGSLHPAHRHQERLCLPRLV